MELITVDQEKCILCGACASVCVRQIFDASEDALKLNAPETCILCGHCKAVCPEDAIDLPALDSSEFVPTPGTAQMPSPDMLMNLFRKRRSTRIYKNQPVEKEKLEQIIQSGRFAPTGGNLQALRYVVVHTPEKMALIRAMVIQTLSQNAKDMEKAMSTAPTDQKGLFAQDRMLLYFEMFKNAEEEFKNGIDRILWNAPVLIGVHVSKIIEKPGVDVGLAGMQMALMAESLGLGSCFIGLILPAVNGSDELKEALMIPKDHQLVTSMVCGYPDISYDRLVSRNPAKARFL